MVNVTTLVGTVVYVISEKTELLATISMLSLLDHWNSNFPLNIYVLSLNPNQLIRKKIVQDFIESQNINCNLNEITVPESFYSQYHRGPLEHYFRLYMQEVVREPQALYIDADTLILDDVSDLILEPMCQYFVGGVRKYISGITYQTYMNQHNLPQIYMASGVMMYNLDKAREINMIQKSLQIISEGCYPISSLINAMAGSYQIKILPVKYHVGKELMTGDPDDKQQVLTFYSLNEVDNALKYPAIVHYSSNWTKPDNPLSKGLPYVDIWDEYYQKYILGI